MSEHVKDKQVDGKHYTEMGIQPWDIIEKNKLDYWEGAALKYILRWKQKDGVIDLDKAIHYLEQVKDLARRGHYGESFKEKVTPEFYLNYPDCMPKGPYTIVQTGKAA